MFPFTRSNLPGEADPGPQPDRFPVKGAARRRALALGMTMALGVSVLAPTAAVFAASPTNDNFSAALSITSLPFTDSADVSGTTAEPGEPQYCYSMSNTVWYAFTPTSDGIVRLDTAGTSFYDTNLNIYTAIGPGFGGLTFSSCASFGSARLLTVHAGTTYYLQGGSAFGGTGPLHVNATLIPPPPNDSFAQATTIATLPFSAGVDTTAATLETNEPSPSCGSVTATAWYAFTPTVAETVTASGSAPFSVQMAVYTGSTLASLSGVACGYGQVSTHLEAGTTYFVQVAGSYSGGGPITFQLAVTPPPSAQFYANPNDASIFDTIQFNDYSYDPGNFGFGSMTWLFGDGSTATGCCPTHRYTMDGDYTVQHTVTTTDGRSASVVTTLPVRTHDVAITGFSVPKTASSGQTKPVIVSVGNKRYTEMVQVRLFEGSPSGLTLIGTFSQVVPARSSKATTDFTFAYTFTTADAAIGKVTFKADVTILGPRDALPADNEAVALPTRVTR
ncbi:MAG: hypothetical protein QOJ75_1093 [Chloroflexota bacterium]|jgi:PKD repeat protein|nr:hypothetical protein [Chloroflexota bacterium]